MISRNELDKKRQDAIRKKEEERAEKMLVLKKNKQAQEKKRIDEQAKNTQRDQKMAQLQAKRDAALKNRELTRKRREVSNASRYSKHEVILLRKVFDEYDKDGEGTINLDEMRETLALKKHEQHARARDGNMHDRQLVKGVHMSDLVEHFFRELDKDNSGEITFLEMLRAMYPIATTAELETMQLWVVKEQAIVEDKGPVFTEEQEREAREVFCLYDTNGDGLLNEKELRDGLSHFLKRSEIDEILAKADMNGDKQINFEEFQTSVMAPVDPI